MNKDRRLRLHNAAYYMKPADEIITVAHEEEANTRGADADVVDAFESLRDHIENARASLSDILKDE